MTSKAVPSRRDFTKAMAALAAAAVPAGGAAMAADDKKLPDEAAHAAAIDTIVRFRFGGQLTEPQLARVRSSYMRHVASARALARIRLANSEDPIAAFRADLP